MMNIYQSINAVMNDVGAVGKDSKNTMQGFMFRGIDAVMNALNPALVKNKVFVIPEVLEQTREERVNAKGTTLIFSICKIKYTFFAEDGTYVEATTIGEGMDTADKATNKAMAAAFKYALFQTFCIPTEEMKHDDPDNSNPTEPEDNKKAEPKQSKEVAEVDDHMKVIKFMANKTDAYKQSVFNHYKVEKVEDMTPEQITDFINGVIKKEK